MLLFPFFLLCVCVSSPTARTLNAIDQPCVAACFDLHHANQFISTAGSSLNAWDLRQRTPAHRIATSHSGLVLDVDHNPNKPYHIASCGEDCLVKFWDLRKCDSPLKILNGHTFWVCTVKFNHFHDQLVLSAGTDAQVNLWSIVSICSAPVAELDADGHASASGLTREVDRLIQGFDEHQDSVYSVAWSLYDAWIFASLSHDGSVVINQVPAQEKYKILL